MESKVVNPAQKDSFQMQKELNAQLVNLLQCHVIIEENVTLLLVLAFVIKQLPTVGQALRVMSVVLTAHGKKSMVIVTLAQMGIKCVKWIVSKIVM